MKRLIYISFISLLFLNASAFSQQTQWSPQNSGTPAETMYSVYFIDPDTGWAFGPNKWYLYTTDGGNNWLRGAVGNSPYVGDTPYGAMFTDSHNGWVSSYYGIVFHTTNGGITWNVQNTGAGSYNLQDVYFSTNTNGWVVGDGGIIYHTADSGATWNSQTSGTSQGLYSLYFTGHDTGWAVGASGTIVYTLDGGINWNSKASGTTEQLNDVYFTDTNNGWIVGNSGMILHTKDRGTTWLRQDSITYQKLYRVHFTDSDNGWICGENGTILITKNGGRNWGLMTSGTNEHLRDIYFTDGDNGWVIGGHGTILRTSRASQWTPSANWQRQNSGTSVNLMGVSFTNLDTGWVVGQAENSYGKILHTVNGGRNWISQPSGVMSNLNDVHFINSNTGWAVGTSGAIIRTDDGGKTWINQTSDTAAVTLQGVHFINSNTGWAVGASGIIIHTVNGGTLWTNQTSNSPYGLNAIYFTDSNTGWAAGDNGTFIHTINGGANWNAQKISGGSIGDFYYSIYFINPDTGWAVGNNGKIIHTKDGGAHWSQLKYWDSYHQLCSVYFTDPYNGWAVGQQYLDNAQILHTADGGAHWNIQPSGTPIGYWVNTIEDVFFVNQNNGWVVGDNGTIMRYGMPDALTQDVTIRFPDTLAARGDTMKIPVSIFNADQQIDRIYSFEFKMLIDTSLTKFCGIDTAGCLIRKFIIDTNYAHPDTFKMTGSSADSLTGDGIFVKLKFVPKSSLTGIHTYPLNFLEFMFNAGSPKVDIYPGKMTIGTSVKKYGDVNLDGSVTSADASALLQYIVGKIVLNGTALIAGDVNKDSKVTAYDAALILRWLVHYISDFPAGVQFPAPKQGYSRSRASLAMEFEDETFVEYSISLENVSDLLSSEIHLKVSGLEFISCIKTDLTGSFMLENNIQNNILNVVLAGAEPFGKNGKILKLKFKKLPGERNIQLNAVTVNDMEITATNESISAIPKTFELGQNYPNPFNPVTEIRYQLPAESKVSLIIYNILGQQVKTLVNTTLPAGYYTILWDGKNGSGNMVSSGLYIFTLRTNTGFSKARKMIYLR